MSKKKTARNAAGRKMPSQVTVTMYNVGFGDCFLLTFGYADGANRRVLIDCGSSSAKKPHMSRVVDQLLRDSEGHVDAVVATHRHSDHISAFGLKGLREKLKSLDPELVIQPWTEHPEAEDAALESPSLFTAAAVARMAGLASAQRFADDLLKNSSRTLPAAGPNVQRQVARIAALSIPNKAAITCLTEMGRRHAYVHAGCDCGLEDLLPGVRVSVLGPPTLKQSEGIRTQKRWDKDEFWRFHAQLLQVSSANVTTASGRSVLFQRTPTVNISRAPSHVKWMIHQLDRAQLHNVKRIVRSLDDALNNTSVILLFEVGDKALLFPGDAQLESWQYVLADRDVKARLKRTTLYKVGHHGSTNATPKSAWDLLRGRRTARPSLLTLLSTKKGHHEGVPRPSLVAALKREATLCCTETWGNKLQETYIL